MQDDEVALGDRALELDALPRVLRSHPVEVVDERLLAVADVRIVLDIPVAGVALDRLCRPAFVEHEVVERDYRRLVPLEALVVLHEARQRSRRAVYFRTSSSCWIAATRASRPRACALASCRSSGGTRIVRLRQLTVSMRSSAAGPKSPAPAASADTPPTHSMRAPANARAKCVAIQPSPTVSGSTSRSSSRRASSSAPAADVTTSTSRGTTSTPRTASAALPPSHHSTSPARSTSAASASSHRGRARAVVWSRSSRAHAAKRG